MTDYQRIAKAITYIKEHSAEQPKLEDIAKAIHLSRYHFHRLFKKWAGVTPKEFLQYISLNRAKKLLQKDQTIEEASFHTGLSSASRLHDLFVNIEGMTPGEFKQGGQQLEIRYLVTESPFGNMLVASTPRGICNLMFVKNKKEGVRELKESWPNVRVLEGGNEHIEQVKNIFSTEEIDPQKIQLHIKGSDFQLKVWEALLKIPAGSLTTYSNLAAKADSAGASRAAGSAVARNPVAWLIPCHRAIKKTGEIGEYHWGATRKMAIIGWEAGKISNK